jgi:hypothetical protein
VRTASSATLAATLVLPLLHCQVVVALSCHASKLLQLLPLLRLAVGLGLRGVTITECTIEDLGAEGISIIDPLAADVLIADCVIGETGVEPTLQ